MTAPLTTNGLIPARDFPVAPYEGVHRTVGATWPAHELYEHYAGAWNAVAYRFHAAVEAGDEFVASVETHGTAPSPEERFRQDQALSTFFGNAYSTFEAAFYGLHTIGAFIDATSFSLDSAKARQQVSPPQTSAAFKRAFPGDPILAAFDALFADPAYLELREIRNVLTHRTAPGRRMYVGIGDDDAPETEWKLNNIPLDATLAQSRRQGIARALSALLAAIEVFVSVRATRQP